MTDVSKPMHPGVVLKRDFLEVFTLSKEELAEALCVSCDKISRIINGTSAIDAELAVRLSQFFGTSPKFWLDLQGQYAVSKVKLKAPIKSMAEIMRTKAARLEVLETTYSAFAGTYGAARDWLNAPHPKLAGKTPYDTAAENPDKVKLLLQSLLHGDAWPKKEKIGESAPAEVNDTTAQPMKKCRDCDTMLPKYHRAPRLCSACKEKIQQARNEYNKKAQKKIRRLIKEQLAPADLKETKEPK